MSVWSIAGKNLKLNDAEEAASTVSSLEAADGVTEVHLGGNTLGVGACEAIANVITTKTALQVADFADIFTGRLITEIPQSLKALCDALIPLSALVEIDLSDNAFGGRSAEPMVALLSSHRHYQILKLNNNGLGPAGGATIARALLTSAENARKENRVSSLKTVVCGRNRLENGSAPLWAEAFAAHGTLEHVRMIQNGIRMEGIAALAKGLQSCPNLETLDLQDNTAAVQGTRAIANSLKSWKKLKHLNLNDCLLRPKGALLLTTALAKGTNPLLTSLRLQSDEIDAKALELLGPAIKLHFPQLEAVELNGNRCEEDDECMVAIKEALAGHGHEDALDEIDDVEEVGSDEEPESEDEAGSEEDEQIDQNEQPPRLGAVAGETKDLGGVDTQKHEDIVKEDTGKETAEPKSQAPEKEDDDLAALMSKTSI